MLKLRRTSNTSNFGTIGISIELGTAQAMSITIDNYSNRWLRVGSEGLFVPPNTIGWANNFYGAVAGSISVKIGLPNGILSQLAQVVNGDVIIALYDTPIAPNPGIAAGISAVISNTTNENQGPGVVSGIADGTSIPIVATLPMLAGVTAGLSSLGNAYTVQRAMAQSQIGTALCPAGVPTLIFNQINYFRVLGILVSTNVTGLVRVYTQFGSFPRDYFYAYLLANTPFLAMMPPSGLYDDGGDISAIHAVGGNVTAMAYQGID